MICAITVHGDEGCRMKSPESGLMRIKKLILIKIGIQLLIYLSFKHSRNCWQNRNRSVIICFTFVSRFEKIGYFPITGKHIRGDGQLKNVCWASVNNRGSYFKVLFDVLSTPVAFLTFTPLSNFSTREGSKFLQMEARILHGQKMLRANVIFIDWNVWGEIWADPALKNVYLSNLRVPLVQ